MTGPTVRCRVDLGRRRARHAAPPASARPRAQPETLAVPAPPTPASGPATPAACVLALAHWIEREVRSRRFASYRDAARHLGVSHARVQHVVGLLFLPASVQAQLLAGLAVSGERGLRRQAAVPIWPAMETEEGPYGVDPSPQPAPT